MKTKALFGCLLASALLGRLDAQTLVGTVISNNLWEPYSIVADTAGNIFVSDALNRRIVKFDNQTGQLTTLAGLMGFSGTNNGTNITARFGLPQGLIAARGGLVVADSINQLIRFVSFSGVVTNIAGAAGVAGNKDNVTGSAARFRYPLGLAADASGNIYIADSKNNCIRMLDTNDFVTTVATNLYEPAGLVVGATNELWVADTRNHVIQCVPPGAGQGIIVAGTDRVSGSTDSLDASLASFNLPRGLLWMGPQEGLFIADSGNSTIRRLYFNSAIGTYSVETVAGMAGQAGQLDGPALSAQFNVPIGITTDPVNGGFLVVDCNNNQVRRISTGPPQPPVSDPVIGYVTLVKDGTGEYVTTMNRVTTATFNNPVVIAVLGEAGTSTYYTSGPTPANSYEDTIPYPGPGTGQSPPPYVDHRPAAEMPPTMLPPSPDLTIKAIGSALGRHSSGLVQARFQFQTGNATIAGDNAGAFRVNDITQGAQMWYTWDGSDPTSDLTANTNSLGPVSTGATISHPPDQTNWTFKIIAYAQGYGASGISFKQFSPSNYVANSISLGFVGGEASSDFVGAAGQRFYAPVTLSVLDGVSMYSLQFNVVVTNLTGPAVDGSQVCFQSMLCKPLPNTDPVDYVPIPPAMYMPGQVFTNLLFTNSLINLLGVGWLERAGEMNLFNSRSQDLITFSRAHDTLFLSANGRVIVGGYSFVIPVNSVNGQTYSITIGRPSATADGIAEDIYIAAPTNGAVSAQQTVTVGSRTYLVGDAAPFRWFNAGDFGDTNLLNNDVLQVFQSAAYSLDNPPPGSDFFDGMDSCGLDINHNPIDPTLLFNGNDTTIDSVVFGDGVLNVADVFVTFRRSLDPSLKWFARYWSNGVLQSVEVPNQAPLNNHLAAAKSKPAPVPMTSQPSAFFSADDAVSAGSRTVQVPIRARIKGGLPARVVMLNLTVQPLDGSPDLTDAVQFTAADGLGAPSYTMSQSAGNFAGAWLDNTVAGVSGTNLLGTLTVTLPTNAPPNAAYLVRFDHLSASPNGLGVFPQQLAHGLLTLADRSASSWNDGIPDSWRLKYFGAVSNLLSAAAADADGDGMSNWQEYLAGTDPTDARSKLQLLPGPMRTTGSAGVHLQWPTGMNCRYVLEFSPLLGGTNWLTLATNIIGDGTVAEFIDTNSVPCGRFYRVRVDE